MFRSVDTLGRRRPLQFISLLVFLLTGRVAVAQLFCVYDPLGTQGDFYSLAKDYQVAAKRWSVNFELRAFTDDSAMIQAFKNGDCDMASMIGMRAREFNKFTGTIDSPAGIETYAQMRQLMALVSSPKLGKFMTNGSYEVAGMVPIGAAYAVVNDRHINSLEQAAGKRVAIMNWDPTQVAMADQFKVKAVPTTLASYGDTFNSGRVDVLIAPMVLYKALELHKGIGAHGGIVRRPMFNFTMQMIARQDRFPAQFGQQSREYFTGQTDRALGVVRNEEAAVEERQWIYAVHSEVVEWDASMRRLLERLKNAGYFDSRMISIMHRIRCKTDSQEQGCLESGGDAVALASMTPVASIGGY